MFLNDMLFCQVCSLERVGTVNFISEDFYIIFTTDNYDVVGCLICRNKDIGIIKVFDFAF